MIGGSIALALDGVCDVLGYDTDADVRDFARDNGFCKIVEPHRMLGCDVVFVCVPVSAVRGVLDDCIKYLPDTVVTDVASVKAPFSGVGGRYVGGHPMAGTERGGIRAAKHNLFKDAYWVITNVGSDADTVTARVRDMGAIPLFMSAEEHDRAVASYSHVPHAAAYALVSSALSSAVSPIAGSGFLDTTRIAKSDEKFWSDVFIRNSKNVADGIKSFMGELDGLRGMIERGDAAELEKYLAKARAKRLALDRSDLGGVTLYVDLVDRVGEFERITGIVARAGINLTNIALVPKREGANGALMLEFSDEKDRARAAAALGIRASE